MQIIIFCKQCQRYNYWKQFNKFERGLKINDEWI